MRAVVASVVAALALAGCAEAPEPATPSQAELVRARWAVWQRDQRIATLATENKALAEQLKARAVSTADAERADVVRRLDELAKANAELAATVADIKRAVDKRAGIAAAPVERASDARDAALLGPMITGSAEASPEEIARLRAQLVRAGLSGITLNAAQVRALLKSLKPTRPIDETSPFAL